MLFDRSQGLFARIVSVSHFRWQRRFCIFELKYLEHCEVLSSWFSISPRSSMNRASTLGRDEVGLPTTRSCNSLRFLMRYCGVSPSAGRGLTVPQRRGAATRNIDGMRLTACATLNLWVRAAIAMLHWLRSVTPLSPVSPKSN